MARRIWLAAAALAATAAAGATTTALHTTTAPRSHPVTATRPAPAATAQAQPAQAQAQPAPAQATITARTTGHSAPGQATFQTWWLHGGHRQYQRVATDLSTLIITDSLQDNDDNFTADSARLLTDATAAARHLPPVGPAGYHAAMTELAAAARQALAGSYSTAFAEVRTALPQLVAFNTLASARLTPAQINA